MPPRSGSAALRADKFALYERAVQDPARAVTLLTRHFRASARRSARILREDFCGSAAIARTWVQRHRDNVAFAVDHDPTTLAWADARADRTLSAAARARLHLRCADVRAPRQPRADAICAFNFSYCVLKTDSALAAYLRRCKDALHPGGILMLDVWGGAMTQVEFEDRQRMGRFVYVWDQAHFDPLTYHIDCRIHFEFADGTALRDAFVYDWRLWTPPELSRLVHAAGFASHGFLWQGTTPRGLGNGRFRLARAGEAAPQWIAYLVARRD
ncbi:MAG: class I SAM-dependent methyltransferase [Planctomycetota bacterium]